MLFKIPKDAEAIRSNNVVIGYYANKAIVKDDLDQLYFILCDAEQLTEGSVVTDNEIQPIAYLDRKEQADIKRLFEEE